MAGLGRKLFTRERATVADVQGYLMDQTIMRFPSASAANAAISAPSEGMHRYLDDVNRLEYYTGAAWVPVRPRTIPRNTTPFSTISAGGANQTGLTGGIAALSSFTLYEASTVAMNATFRGGGASAVMSCTVLINGVQVGDVGVTRNGDFVTSVTGAVALAAGSHTPALRAEASGGPIVWDRARLVLTVGTAE